MQHRNTVLRKYSLLTFLGLSLLALAVPWLAHAGGVHVSVGFELPVLVAVVPAPAPVVVAPAPVVVRQPPVLIEEQERIGHRIGHGTPSVASGA